MTAEMDIPLHVLEKITKNFSVDLRIGRGGYGDVYKGVLCDQELIAVKLLHDSVERLDDELFKNEVGNLLTVDHPNIVQFLGYCYETRSKYVKYNGQNRFSKHIHRVLCFDYLQGGSLDKRLHEQSLPPTWSTHYNIIKGVCEGLNFLHGREPQILHLDLKPANILLDSNMTPKVADFGLSRLFGGSHTHVTRKMIGTEKYMSPDSINECIISPKNDVFSLGVVIIEIMAGPSGYSDFQEDVPKFIHELLNKWSNIIEPTMQYRTQLLLQVKTCIDTAMHCVDSQRENRPTIASILDIFNEIETDIPNTQLAVMPPSRTIDIKNSLAETLKKMTADPDNITNSVANMEHVPKIREASSNVEEPSIIEETEDRETSSYVEEGLIIGRTEERNKILSILSESSTQEMVILPIYGIGGIGKTTLAQLVFSDKKFSGYSQVWVYVSEQLDLYKIGNSIISQLSKKDSNIANMQIIHNRLVELFADKSILIVLDDLWEDKPRELDKLKAMLRLGKGRKVILVTTRDEAIARKICSTVKNGPYKLEILTDDMCWNIIKQKSDFENQPGQKQLEHIGRNIAIKCGGVALAAQSIGYTLRDMSSDEWESVRASDIWNSYDEVLASLRLTYSRMHAFLQSCFSYCAVFPKGHKISKYDLIHQWISLEFTKPSGVFDTMQLCEQYVRKLLGMSFLQCSMGVGPWGEELRHDIYFTMHDLVHDLARSMLADKINKNDNVVGSSCQYALLRDPSMPLQSYVNSPENLKALHFMYSTAPLDYLRRKEIVDTYFTMHDLVHDLARAMLADKVNKNDNVVGSSCQYALLRDPSMPLQSYVNSPENLKALHFLDCAKVKFSEGAISPAKCLLVLDLSGCGILKLPESIGQLKQLRYLSAECFMIPDCITKLSKLNYLSLRYSEIKALPDSIGDMRGLMHLNLYRCYSIRELPVSFAELKQLVHLNLSFCTALEDNVFPEVIGKLAKLRYLMISDCGKSNIQSLLVAVSTLHNLEHLDMSYINELVHIPECFGNLKKLQTLDLSHCYGITELPSWMNKMVSLKIVDMTQYVLKMSKLECSSNLVLFEAIYPFVLEISELENVMSLEEIQSIELIVKRSVRDLKLEWTLDCDTKHVDDKDVLEKLVARKNIVELHVTGYRSLSFPTNWQMGIEHYLPNIEHISLRNLPNCNNLSPLGHLPNLRQLHLHRMDSLEELNTADSCGELMFSNLHTLHISSCPKLRIKPCLPRAVRSISIEASDNMMISFAESVRQTSASSISLLSELDVGKCTVPLHQWEFRQYVPALHDLAIIDCSNLAIFSSPVVIQLLSSLKSLVLKDDILTELPTWLIELTSLQRLTIRVSKLEKLNDSARQLTIGLQSLVLHGCGSITSVPQWLGELTSLKQLYILDCKGIRSLPGSIRKLTELQTLQFESYNMCYAEIRKMFSTISADTDEVNIREWREKTYGRHIWTRQPELDAAGRTAYALVEAPGRTKLSPLQLLPADSAVTASSLDTSNGSRINSSGTRADAAPVGDANVVAVVPCLSALSIESGSAAKNLSVSRFDAGSHLTQNMVRKSRIGVRYSRTRRPGQLVAGASSSESRINNSTAHALIRTGEVNDKAFVSSFSATSVDSGTKKLSGPAVDVISTSTHENVAHKYDAGVGHTSAEEVAVGDANAVALVPTISALSIESGLTTENLSDPPADAVNTSSEEDIEIEEHEEDIGHITKTKKVKTFLEKNNNLDTASGSRINISGIAADAHSNPGVDAATNNLPVPRFDAGIRSTQNMVPKSRVGVRHTRTRRARQLVPDASSCGSMIKNCATHALIATDEVEGKALVSSFAAFSIDSATKRLSGPPVDVINTSTHENVVHDNDAGFGHSSTPKIRQLVRAASATTTNSPDTSGGSRINNSAADALIPTNVVATAAAMDMEDLIRSFSALSLEPGSATDSSW